MSTEARRKAAKGYIKRGVAVIPVPDREKSPGIEGWQNLRIAADEVERHWTNGQNIGLLNGAPSGWRVCVDLDCPEALRLAGRFLPPTLTSGRESTPHAHWWFVSPQAEHTPFKDTNRSTLLELRSSGGHTLVAPSLHPSGERYHWHGESGLEMEEIEADDLTRRVRELATATLIARRLPKHREHGGGGRHDYAMALCGFLLRPGRLDEETTLKVLRAAWAIGGYPADKDKREAHRALEGVVSGTAEKIENGENVVGGPTLEDGSPGVVKLLCKWWGWERKSEAVQQPAREVSVPEPVPETMPWPALNDAALYGLPGEVVKTVEPHTEADPVALLVNLLCAFGNAAGRGAYVRVGADEHHLNLFAALVGETSKARKGMSWGHVRQLMHTTDGSWADDRVLSGLSSGEGLIHAVRDRVEVEADGERKVIDVGVADKRLLLIEAEYGKTLKVMAREGSTLSAVIRSAWDGDSLQSMTKNSPLKSTGSHVSIVGHITRAELLRLLSDSDTQNGYANRFVWILVKRSKALPFGGDWQTVDTTPLVRRLLAVLEFAQTPREMRWGGTAREMWAAVYPDLSEGRPGLFGAATNRAEAQTLRLAALYAVTDESTTIEAEHLEAALALWGYAEQSARYIFGDATGDPVADRIAEELKNAPDGMTRNELRDVFSRHRSSERIGQALGDLVRLGRVRCVKTDTGGRPTERWFSK